MSSFLIHCDFWREINFPVVTVGRENRFVVSMHEVSTKYDHPSIFSRKIFAFGILISPLIHRVFMSLWLLTEEWINYIM